MNNYTSVMLENLTHEKCDSKYKKYVIAVYPDAACHGSMSFQILNDAKPIGYSSQSQIKAWKNAWTVISKKMMKKLETE